MGNSIIFSSEKDSGIYDAMNKGIAKSTGEIISIINSDDWVEKDAISEVVNEYIRLGKPDKAIIYGAMRLFEGEKEKYSVFYNHEFLPVEMINHSASFVTKSVYNTYGVFNPQYKIASDYDFMLRLYYVEKNGKTIILPI